MDNKQHLLVNILIESKLPTYAPHGVGDGVNGPLTRITIEVRTTSFTLYNTQTARALAARRVTAAFRVVGTYARTLRILVVAVVSQDRRFANNTC